MLALFEVCCSLDTVYFEHDLWLKGDTHFKLADNLPSLVWTDHVTERNNYNYLIIAYNAEPILISRKRKNYVV